jgi:hypothetical protein
MAKYRKKALVVTAEIADQPQYVTTLEGVSQASTGDYIVTGIDNEQWVVKPQWFDSAYTHIRGKQYQRKPQVLEAKQIQEPDVVHAATGDIKGDRGDYKVTGTKGEQWFVKPDIFDKTYEKVGGVTMEKHPINDVIKSIGMDGTLQYLPKGMKLHPCDVHGMFLAHYKDSNPLCSLCTARDPRSEGITASEVEHYIDVDPSQALGTNPQQKANPFGF